MRVDRCPRVRIPLRRRGRRCFPKRTSLYWRHEILRQSARRPRRSFSISLSIERAKGQKLHTIVRGFSLANVKLGQKRRKDSRAPFKTFDAVERHLEIILLRQVGEGVDRDGWTEARVRDRQGQCRTVGSQAGQGLRSSSVPRKVQ